MKNKLLIILFCVSTQISAQFHIENGQQLSVIADGVNANFDSLRIDVDSLCVDIDSADGYYYYKRSVPYNVINPNIDTIYYIDSTRIKIGNQYKPNVIDNKIENDIVVSKKGGVLIRHDNWLGGNLDGNVNALNNYLSVLDKYNIKSVLALNEWDERYWVGDYSKYATFWRGIQERGHEIIEHGPYHTNFSYRVTQDYLDVSEETPGVSKITDNTTYYTVEVDTIAGGLVSELGFDILMKRARRLFEFVGLNKPTYWAEGGGQGVYYNIDSVIYGSEINGYVGGGKYDGNKYLHDAYCPPSDWGKYPRYSNVIMKSTYNIQLEELWNARGTQNLTAKEAIKLISDKAARNEMTCIFAHVQIYDPDYWYLSALDSICRFLVENKDEILTLTASEWSKRLYYYNTNPYENTFPHSKSNQVFEDNVDSNYGDTIPDGWILNGDAMWLVDGGSQESMGYCMVGTTDNYVKIPKLYGLEKGLNQFMIDVKDASSSDSVVVTVKEFYGPNHNELANRTTTMNFETGANWVTHTADITINRNTSYAEIAITTKNGTAYIDELVLRKK